MRLRTWRPLRLAGDASGLSNREMFNKIDGEHDGTISCNKFIDYQLKIFDRMDTSAIHKESSAPESSSRLAASPPHEGLRRLAAKAYRRCL